MENKKPQITVSATINAPIEKVWMCWNGPEHITKWNQASPDWHTPKASNDLRVGGKFTSTMAAKDGSMSFDFGGVYDQVVPHQLIAYTLDDHRKVTIQFHSNKNETTVIETFEAEGTNSLELQQSGWQAIMDSFKQYVEK